MRPPADDAGSGGSAMASCDAGGTGEPGLRVREFQEADAAALPDLLRQLGYDVAEEELAGRIARVVAAADHHLVMAVLEARIVGLLHVFIRPALEKPCEAVVQAIVVDGKVRGRGIGKALMRVAEAWATRQGLASIALHTQHAQDFYRPLGYGHVASSDLMRKAL
jgi:GNAT superfamily N-acetyltransferase